MNPEKNKEHNDDSIIINLLEVLKEDEDQIQFHLSSGIININLSHFCKYSRVIQEEYQNEISIKNIIENLERKVQKYKIKEENVKLFFKLLKKDKIEIKNSHYIDFCKLSEIFKVGALKKVLKNYAQKFSNDPCVVINLLLEQNPNEIADLLPNDFISSGLEEHLINKVDACLKIDDFSKLPISSIYRIIEKSDKNKITSDLLYDFIIKSIENRSCLFYFLDLKCLSDKKFDDLYKNFLSEKKNSTCYFKFLQNDLHFLKELNDAKKNLEKEIEKLKQDKKQIEIEKAKENQKSETLINSLKTQKNELESKLESYEIEKQKNLSMIEKLTKEVGKLKEQVNNANRQNEINNSTLNKLNEENKKMKIKINEYESKIKKENEIKPMFIIEYENKPFSGIFNELTEKYKSNICEKGVIDIDGNWNKDETPISTIVDFNYRDRCFGSRDEPNSFICFDFKNNSISVSAYSIKSSNSLLPDFLQSWDLKGQKIKKHGVFLIHIQKTKIW